MSAVRHEVYRVTARGSTEAADKAKALARHDGLRVRTVAAIHGGTHPDSLGFAEWTVALAVSEKGS